MDCHCEPAAVTDPAAAVRNSGSAVARIGDHHTGQITVGVGDSYRHLAHRDVGTWVSASRPEFWWDRRAGARRHVATRGDIHCREGQAGYPHPHFARSAAQSLYARQTQQALVRFQGGASNDGEPIHATTAPWLIRNLIFSALHQSHFILSTFSQPSHGPQDSTSLAEPVHCATTRTIAAVAAMQLITVCIDKTLSTLRLKLSPTRSSPLDASVLAAERLHV